MEKNYPQLNINKNISKIEGIQTLKFEDINEKQFTTLIVGKPGQGKSTLIEQLLTNQDLYFQKFDHVLIVSPSGFQCLQMDDNSSKQFNLSWLIEKFDYIKNQNKKNQNLLIVFDDCISEIKQNENSQIMQTLFFNRRHLIPNCTISILMTTQKYNMCPLKIRTVLSSIYFFDVGQQDLEMIYKELVKIDKKEFRSIINRAFQIDNIQHQFIFIKLNPFKICVQFKPVVLQSDIQRITENLSTVEHPKFSQLKQEKLQDKFKWKEQNNDDDSQKTVVKKCLTEYLKNKN